MNSLLLSIAKSSVRFLLMFTIMLVISSFCNNPVVAQIFEPEGLNMPGVWNAWTNPPANNLAFASNTQVANGRVTKISVGTTRWQTIFSVAATGGDITPGSYDYLFTSGPAANAFQNKWAGVTVVMNTLQNYTVNSGANNNITLSDGKWYTMNWEDVGYANNRVIFMETSANPVLISNVSVPASVAPATAAIITVTTSFAKSAQEIVYLRYSTDSWATSTTIPVTMTGTTGTASIPGQSAATVVSYYAFTSTISGLTADYDLCTIKLNNNTGLNYSYTVTTPPPTITWANLQFPGIGNIVKGTTFDVFGQALIQGVTGQATAAPGLLGWVGYSLTNTDPSTWTNWIPATFNGPIGNNDEFKADLGTAITTSGVYYYATRFKLNSDPYVYGGFYGGFWNGTTNISGVLTVTDPVPVPDFDWVNLQFPGNTAIAPAQTLNVYAQDYIAGVTGQATPAAGVEAWIGYSTTNTNPDTWTNWIPATFSSPVGNNDEYIANIGPQLTTVGTYYYASRFKLNSGSYYYGGYSVTGGGIWNGTTNISGTVVVQNTPPPSIEWANLQFPSTGNINTEQTFDVYGRVFSTGATGTGTASPAIQAWIGYSSTNTDPSTWTQWVPAAFSSSVGNNDEYKGNIGTQLATAGTYYYATRFQSGSGTYMYGGYSASGGGFWDGTTYVSGTVTVIQAFPVLFTVIDGTQLHNNIKFKGQMTNWDTVAMNRNNFTWTKTLNVAPGTYEWGALDADGSPSGLWLIEGPNLVVTIDATGAISGTVTYTTLVTDLPDWKEAVKIYPNPTQGALFISLLTEAQLQLTDMQGHILRRIQYPDCGNTLNISDLTPGMYILQIISKNGTQHYNVVRTKN